MCLIWVWYLIWLIPLVLIVFVDCWTAVFPHILPGMNSEHNVPPNYCTLVNKDRCGKATISRSFFLEKPCFFPTCLVCLVCLVCFPQGSWLHVSGLRIHPRYPHGRARPGPQGGTMWSLISCALGWEPASFWWCKTPFLGVISFFFVWYVWFDCAPWFFGNFVWDDSYIGWGWLGSSKPVLEPRGAACGGRIPRFQS